MEGRSLVYTYVVKYTSCNSSDTNKERVDGERRQQDRVQCHARPEGLSGRRTVSHVTIVPHVTFVPHL
jgi:hypothetical protein